MTNLWLDVRKERTTKSSVLLKKASKKTNVHTSIHIFRNNVYTRMHVMSAFRVFASQKPLVLFMYYKNNA